MFKTAKLARSIFVLIAMIIVVLIFMANYAPFGINKSYETGQGVSDLAPPARVEKISESGETLTRVKDDLVYFTTKMPFEFDDAVMKITYKDPSEDQQIDLGFQDKSVWHYAIKTFNQPFFTDINWNVLGDGPYVYQRNASYKSVDDFIARPPTKSVIGTFDYDDDTLDLSDMNMQDYKPSQTDTAINTPLRGKHIIYAFVKDEPFKMTLTKQDLNWYEDPDPMEVSVYKDSVKVYDLLVDDDGISDASKNVSAPQQLTIQNPGPGLPEQGVYKIVIDATPDIVITQIRSNFHKVVFDGPLNPIENSAVFNSVVTQTKPTLLFSNAKQISALTYHSPALQDIIIASPEANLEPTPTPSTSSGPSARGKRTPVASASAWPMIHLADLNTTVSTDSGQEISKILIPRSDVILNGFLGYFSFSQDQLFYPSAYSVYPITQKEDLDKVDYVLTNYRKPQVDGEWKTATIKFNLTQAVIKNGKLSWLIRAPQLKENGREIIVKNIEVEFKKEPSFHFKWPW